MKDKPTLKKLINDSILDEMHDKRVLQERILKAFDRQDHTRDIDPDTNKPFTSFYRWLMVPPPPGVGLASSPYVRIESIIGDFMASRDRLPEKYRKTINALIEDLTKGHGAKKEAGGNGSNQHKRVNSNRIGTNPVALSKRRGSGVRKAETLAARLAESTEPKVRKAWEGYLEGNHKSVTAAAISCIS